VAAVRPGSAPHLPAVLGPVGWTVLGSVLLLGVVVLAAYSQAAIYQCEPCSGDFCGPDGQTCPTTPYFVSVFVLAIGLASATITHGLSGLPTRGYGSPSASAGRTHLSGTRGHLQSGAFLLFLGWGLAAWGILQLWSLFAQCIEPCAPGFDLQGIPLEMVVAGFFMAAFGGALFLVPLRVSPPGEVSG